jgi:hypothetical protein
VSLQGSLDTFALPDVLVLLASTKKSGELHVAGTRTAGTPRANDLQGLLWVDAGQLVGFDVARATEAAEAVFELLRLEAGSFSFMGGTAAPAPGPPLEIEPVLAEAQSRLTEWREIERIVPSSSCWLDLSPEPPAAHVSMRAEQWRLIVAVGGGCNVEAIVEHLGGSELAGCRAVKELIEAGLVRLTEAPPEFSAAPALSLVGQADSDSFTTAHPASRSTDDAPLVSFGGDGHGVDWLSPRADEPTAAGDPGDEISKAVAAAAAEAVASVVHGPSEGEEAEASGLPVGQTLEDFDSLVTLPPRARKSRAGASEAAKEAAAAETASAKSGKGFAEKRTLGAFLDEKASRDNTGSLSEAQALTRQLASLGDEPSGGADLVEGESGQAAEVDASPVAGTATAEPGTESGQVEGADGAEGADDEPLNRGLLLKFLSSVRN